jgi:hypothetical protein
MADGLIAALEHGLTLVTRNVKDFEQLDPQPFGLTPSVSPWLFPDDKTGAAC